MKTTMQSIRTILCTAVAFGSVALAAPVLAATLDPEDVVPQHINELPFYGNVTKTREMKKADETFKKEAIEKAGSAPAASERLMKTSWELFKDKKLNIAMRRLNEAWLLNEKNYRIYWAMAVIQIFRGAPKDEVDSLFKEAVEHAGDKAPGELNRDYEHYKDGDESNPVENLKEIGAAYAKARSKLISANSH